MSKHNNYRNYQNYSNNKPQVEQPEVVEEVVVTEPEIKEEVAEAVEEVIEPVQVAEPAPAPAPKKARPVKGIVSNCNTLRVRKAPNTDATVLAIIEVNSEVRVDKSQSTDDFYKVCTATGVEGYCMKKFITL